MLVARQLESVGAVLYPDWAQPDGVHSLCFASALGEQPGAAIPDALPLPLRLPRQRHGAQIASLNAQSTARREGDITYTTAPGEVCAVVAADCLPLLLCDRSGAEVAAVHAGWRGLAAGVLAAAVDAFKAPAGQLIAWIGPAIGGAHYPVGEDVHRALASLDGAEDFFEPVGAGRWQLELRALACHWLQRRGLATIYDSGLCCWSDRRWHSVRRDGAQSGRNVVAIWRQGPAALPGT